VLGRLLPDAQLDMRFTERRLQLLDPLEQLPLARVRSRLAVLGQPLLAVLQKQPLSV
jgi:hypothetical protein